MSKDKISDYSATANSNTDIAGINIDEGCAPSGINNAIRTLMKQLKDFQQGTNSDSFNGPTNGAHNGTVGATTPAAGTFTTLTASGNVVLGDASTDTLNVGNGGLIKDASGNLGLGVTPSAWSAYKAIDLLGGGSVISFGNTAQLVSNYYYNGTNNIYKATAGAAGFVVGAGSFSWFNAPSGTAGNTVTLTQAMTLDASGNLGVGTTSPGARLDVSSASSAVAGFSKSGSQTVYAVSYASNAGIAAESGGLNAVLLSSSNNLIQLYTNNAERARIDSSGNFTIGGQSATRLEVNLTENDKVELNAVDSTNTARNLVFSTGDTERARIDSSGNLMVGTTSVFGGSKLTVSTASGRPASFVSTAAADSSTYGIYVAKFANDSTTSQRFVGFSINNDTAGSGQINANGASQAAFGSFSDARLKENIVDLSPQLASIMALRPVEFDYKTGGHQTGFIAQEMQSVFPDAVGEADGFLTVTGWNKTGAILVKAIQEQQAIIESLKARLDAANL